MHTALTGLLFAAIPFIIRFYFCLFNLTRWCYVPKGTHMQLW